MRQRYLLPGLLLLLLAPCVYAQDTGATAPQTHLSKFLEHFDGGLAGTVLLTHDASGTVASGAAGAPYTFTQSASTAAGAVVTLRGSKSPYKGFEFNYGYGRITESYTCCNQSVSTGAYVGPFQSQVTKNEVTFGYLAKPPHLILGAQPFISVGAGTTVFSPTLNGGQGLKKQARATYYYSAGLEKYVINDTFGVRVGIRQSFYLAPDFDQPYLRILQHTFTTEPQVGIFLHF